MQSLILVLLSIGAASAAPQRFFVLPDFLVSALTHSGFSHPELVPVVIPIGDHSKQKTESSSSDFDVFMKVREGNKESTTLNEDVPSTKEDAILPVEHSNSPNPVEMLLNELQRIQVAPANEQTDETLLPTLNSEIAPITTDIQQSDVHVEIPEILTPTKDSASQTNIEKVSDMGSHLENKEQVTEAAESPLNDASGNLKLEENEEPKENVAVEEVQENVSTGQNAIKTDEVAVEAVDIKQQPAIQVKEQQHLKETTFDDNGIAAKQEAVETAVIADEIVEIQAESTPQEAVKEVIIEKAPTKPEDMIHEKTSSSTGKSLSQDKDTDEENGHTKGEPTDAHVVDENLKEVATQKVETLEEEVKKEKTQSTLLGVEDDPIQVSNNEPATQEIEKTEETLITELPNEKVQETTLELEKTKEQEQEKPVDAETPTQEVTKEATVEQENNAEAQINDKLSEEASHPQLTEEPIQTEEIIATELKESKAEPIEVPVQELQSEIVAQQEPTKIQSSLSENAVQATPQINEEVPSTPPEDAVEAQLTEEAAIRTEHTEVVAQTQSTEGQSSLSQDAVQATPQITDEVPAVTSEDVVESKLTEEAPIRAEQTKVSVQVMQSEEVAQPQPTEAQSSFSEDAIQATLQLEEIPATLSEDVVEPKLTEVNPTRTEQIEVPGEEIKTEEVDQPQPTGVQSSFSEDAVHAPPQLEESPATLSEDVVEPNLTEVDPSRTEQIEAPVQEIKTEEVDHPQPTEVQSSLSEDAVQAPTQIIVEVPAAPFEVASEVQAEALSEVQVKEIDQPIESPGSVAEPASESFSDSTIPRADNLEENQITGSKILKPKSLAKSNLTPSSGKSFDSVAGDGFKMKPVGLAVQNHFGFSSNLIRMPDPVQYLHNGAIVDPRSLVEPRYRPFFYHNDSPDIIRAKVLFFQHQGNISPKF